MKKKGFTLIELIVVIAIIGVLAAILVPVMMGYTSKSRIMSSNAAARDIDTAVSIAMLEMMQHDFQYTKLVNVYTYSADSIDAETDVKLSSLDKSDTDDMEKYIKSKIHDYFSSNITADAVSIHIRGGVCDAIGVITRGYPGSYPIAISADDYRAQSDWDSVKALNYALTHMS